MSNDDVFRTGRFSASVSRRWTSRGWPVRWRSWNWPSRSWSRRWTPIRHAFACTWRPRSGPRTAPGNVKSCLCQKEVGYFRFIEWMSFFFLLDRFWSVKNSICFELYDLLSMSAFSVNEYLQFYRSHFSPTLMSLSSLFFLSWKRPCAVRRLVVVGGGVAVSKRRS